VARDRGWWRALVSRKQTFGFLKNRKFHGCLSGD
jgi:hypothetical protein